MKKKACIVGSILLSCIFAFIICSCFQTTAVQCGKIAIFVALMLLTLWLPIQSLIAKIRPLYCKIAICCFLPCFMIFFLYQDSIKQKEFQFYTFYLIVLSYLIIRGILGSVRWALLINSGFYCILLLANNLALSFRGSPFRPSDILSLKTAWSVRNGYIKSFRPTFDMVMIVLFFAWNCVLFWKLRLPKQNKKWKEAIIRISCVVMAVMGWNMLSVMGFDRYEHNGFRKDFHIEDYGFISQFALECRSMHISAPEGYHREEAEEYLNDSEIVETGRYPDIFVIMDEAFCDYSMVMSLPLNQDYLPYFHSISEEEKGACYVSVLGGNTCNTEWEFLTGNSLAFYPEAIPYNQYIQEEKDSFVRHLKRLGYDTVAVHPWYATGWNRDIVYPMLGFDRFYSILDFDNSYTGMSFDERKKEVSADDSMYIRDLISDQASFDKVIQLYKEHCASSDAPFFAFNVTMQNHGSYLYEDYESPVQLTGKMSNQKTIAQYLGLAYETDRALEKLVDYLQTCERDVVLLFFGDHQPQMFQWFYQDMNKDDPNRDELYLNEKKYVVPYFLWSNRERSRDDYKELSSNYLSLMLLDYAGLPSNRWYDFLRETYHEVPVINAFGQKDRNGNWLENNRQIMNERTCLKQYEILQYYRMFDE